MFRWGISLPQTSLIGARARICTVGHLPRDTMKSPFRKRKQFNPNIKVFSEKWHNWKPYVCNYAPNKVLHILLLKSLRKISKLKYWLWKWKRKKKKRCNSPKVGAATDFFKFSVVLLSAILDSLARTSNTPQSIPSTPTHSQHDDPHSTIQLNKEMDKEKRLPGDFTN